MKQHHETGQKVSPYVMDAANLISRWKVMEQYFSPFHGTKRRRPEGVEAIPIVTAELKCRGVSQHLSVQLKDGMKDSKSAVSPGYKYGAESSFSCPGF